MSEQEERIPSLTHAVPNYIPPTPEQIVRTKEEIRVRVERIEAANQRIAAISKRIGGEKETPLASDYEVLYCIREDGVSVMIDGTTNSIGYSDRIDLSPQAVLALLAWLEREKATLEKLAKEQR